MIPDSILNASGVTTVAGLVSDLVVHAIQQAQREKSGLPLETLGVIWRILISLISNFSAAFVFAYGYHSVALGSGRAFLAGGLLWLCFVIPVLITAHHVDDRRRATITTRVFGWLFKFAVASAAIDYFIG